ncbi:MAG: hypothetical protein R3E21_08175 [Caenibius sp.]
MSEANALPVEEANGLLDTLATSLSTLSTALAARVGDGTPAYVAFGECVEREARRLRENGGERLAEVVRRLNAPGYRMLKEGW